MGRRIIAPPLLVLALLLSTVIGPALAQDQSNDGPSHSSTTGGFTPTTVIVLVVLVGAFFVLTFFSIYINRCAPPRPPPPRRTAPDDQNADGGVVPRARGLDKELVESFLTAVYGDVKARVAGMPGPPLECAVCLAEFEDRDELRVLPACCHVFHPGCIDPWLAAAVTCPLCRADLTAPPRPESCDLAEAVVPEEPEEEEDRNEACLVGNFTPESLISFGAARSHEFHYRRTQSAVDGMPDRHTLRLPEHVMKELAAVRRHRRAASLAGYPDAAVERTPRWLASFWRRSVSWQRHSTDAGEEHGGSKRVVPITESSAECPSGSGCGGGEKEEKQDADVALNRV
jgi:E3 ubiquitin-protein ligase ATL6/9/15/31/42/55